MAGGEIGANGLNAPETISKQREQENATILRQAMVAEHVTDHQRNTKKIVRVCLLIFI